MAKPTKTNTGAVPVSRNLQIFFVVTAALSALFGLLVLVPLYVTNTAGYRGDYALGMVVWAIFPILLFAAAYGFSPKYPTILQRVFIAVIKSGAVGAVVMFLLSFKNQLWLFFPAASVSQAAPNGLLTSFTIDYALMAIALIGTIVYSFVHYRPKHPKH